MRSNQNMHSEQVEVPFDTKAQQLLEQAEHAEEGERQADPPNNMPGVGSQEEVELNRVR